MDYAKDNDLIFMETSAKTAMNVQELFVTVGTCNFLYILVLVFDHFTLFNWFISKNAVFLIDLLWKIELFIQTTYSATSGS